MSEVKKSKDSKMNSNAPVQKSAAKGNPSDSGKNKLPKGKAGKNVSSSPTTEVNPEG